MRTVPGLADPGRRAAHAARKSSSAQARRGRPPGRAGDHHRQVARVATLGDIDANVPKLDEGERRIPIRVRLPAKARADMTVIRALQVPHGQRGLDAAVTASPMSISRPARR